MDHLGSVVTDHGAPNSAWTRDDLCVSMPLMSVEQYQIEIVEFKSDPEIRKDEMSPFNGALFNDEHVREAFREITYVEMGSSSEGLINRQRCVHGSRNYEIGMRFITRSFLSGVAIGNEPFEVSGARS